MGGETLPQTSLRRPSRQVHSLSGPGPVHRRCSGWRSFAPAACGMVRVLGATCLVLFGVLGLQPSACAAGVWSSPVNIHPGTQGEDGYPEMIIAIDGTAWIAWMGRDSTELDEEAFFSRWDGLAWLPASTINPANQTDDRFPRLSCAPDGTLWAIWKGPDPNVPGSYVGLTSRWHGTGWTIPDTVWTGGGRHDFSELAAVSSAEAWFIRDGYAPQNGTSDIYVYHHVGNSRAAPHQFAQPESSEYEPTLAVDLDGVVWALWYQVPPLSPTRSTLQYSRRIGAVWEPPSRIPEPQGLVRMKVIADRDNAKWAICSALDPAIGPFSNATWALRWEGTEWGAPRRISNPIAASDSVQFQHSWERTCAGYPRSVWLLRDLDNRTRADILTTAWDGQEWSAVELMGNLADSANVEWPSVATQDGRIWVAYMKHVAAQGPTKVFTTFSIGIPTDAAWGEIAGTSTPRGALISWSFTSGSDVALGRIFRAPGKYALGQAPAPPLGVLVYEMGTPFPPRGEFLDTTCSTPGVPLYTYWLEIISSRGVPQWYGPRTVHVPENAAAPRFTVIQPNPSDGSVSIRGILGGRLTVDAILILDVQGRLIRKVMFDPTRVGGFSPSEFRIGWDGRTSRGDLAPSGVYQAKLLLRGESSRAPAIKLVLMR